MSAARDDVSALLARARAAAILERPKEPNVVTQRPRSVPKEPKRRPKPVRPEALARYERMVEYGRRLQIDAARRVAARWLACYSDVTPTDLWRVQSLPIGLAEMAGLCSCDRFGRPVEWRGPEDAELFNLLHGREPRPITAFADLVVPFEGHKGPVEEPEDDEEDIVRVDDELCAA